MISKKHPLVSVIIPFYNLGDYLEEAIVSVIKQSYSNIEIIVINDGSTDQKSIDTLNKLKIKFKNKVIFIDQKNQKLPSARNNGIKISKGEYICCLDSDDILHPQYIESTVREIVKDSKIGIVTTWLNFFGEYNDTWQASDFFLPRLLTQNSIHVASLFRKSAWKKVKGYSTYMDKGYEDWEFWIKIASSGFTWTSVKEPLFFYRVRKNSMVTGSNQKRTELISDIVEHNKKCYQEHLSEIIDLINKEYPVAPRLNINSKTKFKALLEQNANLELKINILQNNLNRVLTTKGWRFLERIRPFTQKFSKFSIFNLILPLSYHQSLLNQFIHKLQFVTKKKYCIEKLVFDRIFNHNSILKPDLISICILSFNRLDDTKRLLNSIKKYTKHNYEILILDQNSDNETKKFLENISDKKIKVFFSKENLGCSGGRKFLISKAKGNYIVQLDNDLEVQSNWLNQLVNAVNWKDNIGGACGRVTFPTGKTEYNGGFYSINKHNIIFSLDGNGKNQNDPYLKSRQYCDWIPGGGTIFKTEVFKNTNYDINFLNGYEDNDLSLRLAQKGWKFVNCPECVLIHHHRMFFDETQTTNENKYIQARTDINRMRSSFFTFFNKHKLIINDQELLDYLNINHGILEKQLSEYEKYSYTNEFIEPNKHNNLKFSIIVPSFNHAEYLETCLNSISNQSYKNFELIIIDDHSSDNSVEIITHFLKNNKSIVSTFIKHSQQKNISKTLNEGILQASGDYIVLIDCDDELLDYSLQQVHEYLSKNHTDYLSTQIIDMDKDGIVTQFRPRNESPKDLFSGMYAGHLKVFKKDLFEKIGYFHSDITGVQDYDFALRTYINKHEITFLQKYLYKYRWHDKTVSLNNISTQEQKTKLVQDRSHYYQDLINNKIKKENLPILFIKSNKFQKLKNFPFYIYTFKNEQEIKIHRNKHSQYLITDLSIKDLKMKSKNIIDIYYDLTKKNSLFKNIVLDNKNDYISNLKLTDYAYWRIFNIESTNSPHTIYIKNYS